LISADGIERLLLLVLAAYFSFLCRG